MNDGVVIGALLVAFLNLVPALIGGLRWYRGDPADRHSERVFWISLRIGQAGAVVFALSIGVLAALGDFSSERLFYLYALLPLAIAFVAEQLRITSAETILERHELDDAQAVGGLPADEQQAIVGAIMRREMGVMTLSSIVVAFLCLRAAGTAHF